MINGHDKKTIDELQKTFIKMAGISIEQFTALQKVCKNCFAGDHEEAKCG